MAEQSVIREFLVALGFKSDEAALKKFENGVDKATKTVFGLATAIETTAVIVAAGVSRFASNLEALYFASIKTAASATNLKAFDRASQNLGTSAGEALQSVQGIARFMRTNPGGEGLIESLGVQTHEANGELRDMTDIMLGLSKKFATMPYYLASQYAGMFGISEDTLRAMRSGGFEDEVKRMREQMKNSGFDQATKDAHRFMMGMRDLTTQLEAFGVQVFDAVAKKLGVSLKSITDWLRDNGPMLAERTAEVLVAILNLAERIGSAIMWLIDLFIKWDNATDGWSTRLLGFLVVMKMLGGFEVIGAVIKLGSAFVNLGTGITSAAAAGTGFLAVLTRIGLVGAAAYGGWKIGEWISDNLSEKTKDKIGKGIALTLGALGNRDAQQSIAIQDPALYLRMNGWTPEQAAGIVANLQAESGMNPYAVGDHGKAYGLAQWHPDRQEAFAKWAGHDMRQSNTAEQLDFLNYELKQGAERKAGALLSAATNARQASEIVTRHYERPNDVEGEAKKRGDAAAVMVSQKNEINIHGSNDPAATGRAVADEQSRVNAELTRNLAVAVQ